MPSKPLCNDCPLKFHCYAFNSGKLDLFPSRKIPPSRRTRYFHYLVVLHNGDTYIRQRQGRDIWEKLYEFPLIETERTLSPGRLVKMADWHNLFAYREMNLLKTSRMIRHQLTHQEIIARFYKLAPSGKNPFIMTDYIRINTDEVSDYPLPVLISRTMKELEWI